MNREKKSEKLELKREKIVVLGARTGVKAGLLISAPPRCSGPTHPACIQ
jgi:hypothetical protein